jgi:hypothetical protein
MLDQNQLVLCAQSTVFHHLLAKGVSVLNAFKDSVRYCKFAIEQSSVGFLKPVTGKVTVKARLLVRSSQPVCFFFQERNWLGRILDLSGRLFVYVVFVAWELDDMECRIC